jgi:hypothetical protein
MGPNCSYLYCHNLMSAFSDTAVVWKKLQQNLILTNVHILSPVAEDPPVGQGILITEASRSYSDTQHSIGLLWPGNQPLAEISENTHKRETCPGGIRTHYLSRREAADPRLRPRGHSDRQNKC